MANKYIEVREGLSILKKSIESIEMLSGDGIQDNGTRIVMNSGDVHESTFPYITLLKLLETPEAIPAQSIEEKFEAVLDSDTTFSG
jgi:hypothetical protein